MENHNQVSFVALESVSTRLYRIIKMLVIALVVSILVNLVSNGLWIYMWLQYDYYGVEETVSTETVTVDGKSGIANYANHGGSVVNGTDSSTYRYADQEGQKPYEDE